MSSDLSFYQMLPLLADFAHVADADAYTAAPDDWRVIVADVEDSTGAIRAGRYKEVNMAGAAVLACVFNALETIDLPFIFGGDGATIVLPAALARRVAPALAATRGAIRDSFGLHMRIGIVSVKDLHDGGFRVGVARVRLNDGIALAAFSGTGVAEAERRIKCDPKAYGIPESDIAPDFSGLECRWNGIPAPEGLMLSVLVTPLTAPHETLAEVLALIAETHPVANPIAREALSLSTDATKLAAENALRGGTANALMRALRLALLRAHTAVGRFLIERRVRLPFLDMSRYKTEVVANSDHRKYDGTLRVVLASSPARRDALATGLERLFVSGRAAYGIHGAPEALMTCLVFNRNGLHLHFLDVDQGGYASAAVDLKQRLRSR